MSAASTSSIQLNAIDPRSMGDIARLSRENSPEGVKAAAKQFEALFLNTVLKSMRDATPTSSYMDNEQTKLYQSLLDQQLASNLSQRGGTGLADVIARQLTANMNTEAKGAASAAGAAVGGLDSTRRSEGFPLAGVPTRPAAIRAAQASEAASLRAALAPERGDAAVEDDPVEAFFAQFVDKPVATSASPAAGNSVAGNATADEGGVGTAAAGEAASSSRSGSNVPAHVRDFVRKVMPHALEVAKLTGIPAEFMVAQAALETGWGRGELRAAGGQGSHNLFNIKAGKSWDGKVVATNTTEYDGGRAYNTNARFRAYSSYAESFQDYANLLLNSPRYADVVGQKDAAGFARGLQDAGYATDPRYAEKLTRIIDGGLLKSALQA